MKYLNKKFSVYLGGLKNYDEVFRKRGGRMLKEESIAKVLKASGKELTLASDIKDGDSWDVVREKTTKVLKRLIKVWGGR